MKGTNKNIEIGRKLYSLRDTINDQLYVALVEACRNEDVNISRDQCQDVAKYCQGQVSKVFEAAMTQILADLS